jgi:hypothetical protein
LTTYKDKVVRASVDQRITAEDYHNERERIEAEMAEAQATQSAALPEQEELTRLIEFAGWVLEPLNPSAFSGSSTTNSTILLLWRPQGDSNPRYRRERAMS